MSLKQQIGIFLSQDILMDSSYFHEAQISGQVFLLGLDPF